MTQERFNILLKKWAKDTMFDSFHITMKEHPIYHQITTAKVEKEILIGYICQHLEKHIHLCLILLYDLVDNPPPIDEYYLGRVPVIKECWVYWAIKNNHIKNLVI